MALAEYGNAFNIDTGANGDPILIDAQSGQTVATYDRTQSAWVYGDIISDSVNTESADVTNQMSAGSVSTESADVTNQMSAGSVSTEKQYIGEYHLVAVDGQLKIRHEP